MKTKKNRELTLVTTTHTSPTFVVLDEHGYPTKHKPTKAEIAHWHATNRQSLSDNPSTT